MSDEAKESVLQRFRDQIRLWADTGDKLDDILMRLETSPELNETERYLLGAVAKADTRKSLLTDAYYNSLNEVDG